MPWRGIKPDGSCDYSCFSRTRCAEKERRLTLLETDEVLDGEGKLGGQGRIQTGGAGLHVTDHQPRLERTAAGIVVKVLEDINGRG